MDLETKREDQRQEAIKQKELMASLIKHPGWVFLSEIAGIQVKNWRDSINRSPTTEIVVENFIKGQCLGIESIIATPQKVLDGAKEALDLLKKESE